MIRCLRGIKGISLVEATLAPLTLKGDSAEVIREPLHKAREVKLDVGVLRKKVLLVTSTL